MGSSSSGTTFSPHMSINFDEYKNLETTFWRKLSDERMLNYSKERFLCNWMKWPQDSVEIILPPNPKYRISIWSHYPPAFIQPKEIPETIILYGQSNPVDQNPQSGQAKNSMCAENPWKSIISFKKSFFMAVLIFNSDPNFSLYNFSYGMWHTIAESGSGIHINDTKRLSPKNWAALRISFWNFW